MKRKVFLVSMMIFAMVAITAQAQRNCMQTRPGARRGPQPEAKAYLEQNVLPVMKIQRQELDKQISADDKARLNEIRAEMKSMRTMMTDRRQTFRESDERPTLEQRREMREHRNKMQNLWDEVEIMTEKYDAEINSALENLRDNVENWKQEMMELCPNPNPGMGRDFRGRGNRRGFQQNQFNNAGTPLRRLQSPVGFLLYNPDEPLTFFEDAQRIGENKEINLFPNPANDQVQVSFELDQDEFVTVEVLDKDGKVVIDGTGKEEAKGVFSTTLNLNSLHTGIYFVKISAGNETLTRQLIVQK
jgi:archaellum component FlaC